MSQSNTNFTGSPITFRFWGTLNVNVNKILAHKKAIFINLLYKIKYVLKYLIVEIVRWRHGSVPSIIQKGLPDTKKMKAKCQQQSNFIV
jgi:hypothetical protein